MFKIYDFIDKNIWNINVAVNTLSVILIVFSLFLGSCVNPLEPVDSGEEEKVKSELKDRSFRQFAPSKGAIKRKGVILDFFENEEKNISLWSQYAEGDTAINEWEIFANDYRVEKGGSEYRLYFTSPNSHQNLPNKCDNCIETKGISISIRNLFDSEEIEFRVNDPENSLPSPFPVFTSWTRFSEDEYFD
ncbi:MAG: hypothetical protein OXD54_08785 [Candidatus Poribacteria bacterium]|nr:hypothetical protein [Candidatus Poribacteria bacterium]